jgi:hypothetical protein
MIDPLNYYSPDDRCLSPRSDLVGTLRGSDNLGGGRLSESLAIDNITGDIMLGYE